MAELLESYYNLSNSFFYNGNVTEIDLVEETININQYYYVFVSFIITLMLLVGTMRVNSIDFHAVNWEVLVMSSSATLPVICTEMYPARAGNPGEGRITDSLITKNNNSLHQKNSKNDSITNNNNNNKNSTSTNNINASSNNNYLGRAEMLNIENDRVKYFSGLKTNLEADMDTFLELMSALCYAVYGIFVSIILTFIPRRFRYKDITGQVVLVTGAGSGIGRMMAKKLALQHGAVIVAWDINKTGNEETVKEIVDAGGKATAYVVDVSSRASIYEAADKVKEEVGKVEILVNNAGVVSGRKLLDIPDHLIEKTMQVNTLSNFWTIKAFLPGMMRDGHGQIVTIASTAGLIGVNRLVDYCASKFAAIGISEAIQSELRAEPGYEKIYTTLVCPYFINTGMFDGVRSKIIPILKPEDVVDDIVAGILTNQEQIVIPRWIYTLLVLKMIIPGEVGRRIAAALGITGTMMNFKGRVGSPSPPKGANKSMK